MVYNIIYILEYHISWYNNITIHLHFCHTYCSGNSCDVICLHAELSYIGFAHGGTGLHHEKQINQLNLYGSVRVWSFSRPSPVKVSEWKHLNTLRNTFMDIFWPHDLKNTQNVIIAVLAIWYIIGECISLGYLILLLKPTAYYIHSSWTNKVDLKESLTAVMS